MNGFNAWHHGPEEAPEPPPTPTCPDCGRELWWCSQSWDWFCDPSPDRGGCGWPATEAEVQDLEEAEAESWPVGEEPAEVSAAAGGETSLVPAWALGLAGHGWGPSAN